VVVKVAIQAVGIRVVLRVSLRRVVERERSVRLPVKQLFVAVGLDGTAKLRFDHCRLTGGIGRGVGHSVASGGLGLCRGDAALVENYGILIHGSIAQKRALR
jgi:hypothetical protein